MSQVELIEEELTIEDLENELEEDRKAARDLQRIENEIKEEAESAVAKADRHGDERASAEAASVAFDFAEAERATEEIEAERDARGADGEVVVEREILVDAGDIDLDDADWEMDADWVQGDRDDRESGIVDFVKESLGDAAEAVKSAAHNAKEQAKEVADNIKRQM